MKYHLAKQGDDVVISFEQLEGQAQALICLLYTSRCV